MKVKKTIKVIKFKAGYIVKEELIDGSLYNCDDFVVKRAYNLNNNYIGDPKMAYFLCKKKGIKPELIDGNSVCSIGFCYKDQKWYGWSHRAICGFGIGHVVEAGNCEALEDREAVAYNNLVPVGFEVKKLDDAKKCAIAFAKCVS